MRQAEPCGSARSTHIGLSAAAGDADARTPPNPSVGDPLQSFRGGTGGNSTVGEKMASVESPAGNTSGLVRSLDFVFPLRSNRPARSPSADIEWNGACLSSKMWPDVAAACHTPFTLHASHFTTVNGHRYLLAAQMQSKRSSSKISTDYSSIYASDLPTHDRRNL